MEAREGKDPAVPAEMEGVQSNEPPSFLNKLYDSVDDNSTDSLLSWSTGGKSFIVWNPDDFAKDFLPQHFGQHKFDSFRRRLNYYGFRKVVQMLANEESVQFASEGFVRGQRHLLKDIRRPNPVPRHQTPQQQQQPQSSTLGPCGEVDKFGLASDVEKLTRDKNLLMRELVRLMQQLEADRQDLQVMGQRFEVTEQRQRRMRLFLVEAFQDPTFRAHLIQQNEINKRLVVADMKNRGLPELETEGGSGTFYDVIGQIVKYQPAAREAATPKLVQSLRSSDLDTGNHPLEALRADLGSAPVDQADENGLANRSSGFTLTGMQVCPPEPPSMDS